MFMLLLSMYYTFFSLDTPNQPKLIVSSNNVISGEDVVLTCDSSTVKVTTYQFKKGDTVIATVPAPASANEYASYGISSASVNYNKEYTCVALIDDVSSEESSAESVEGKVFIVYSNMI